MMDRAGRCQGRVGDPMIRSSFLFLRILTDFISRQWSHVADGSVRTHAKSRQTRFNSRGTIKNVHARFNVWIPQSKYATRTCGHFPAGRTCCRGSVLCDPDQVQQPPAGSCEGKGLSTGDEPELFHKTLHLVHHQEPYRGALHLHPQRKSQGAFLI